MKIGKDDLPFMQQVTLFWEDLLDLHDHVCSLVYLFCRSCYFRASTFILFIRETACGTGLSFYQYLVPVFYQFLGTHG